MPSKQGQRNSNPLKRKALEQPNESNQSRKRVKGRDARTIATQTSGKAFGNGEIDVDKFVKAREFEIRAIEESMKRAKKSLSNRAFQNVSRDLRRRTASHDVKRVPKRLRARAKKEMIEDNTPTVNSRTRKPTSRSRLRMETAARLRKLASKPRLTEATTEVRAGSSKATPSAEPVKSCKSSIQKPRMKKNTLQKPPKPKAKFRKRQVSKSWLPTHLFHAKRAHMTPPREPLWRISVPLSPIEKSYRPTHRASRQRGAITWDTSYMATIGLEGPEKSLQSLLRAMGVGAEQGNEFWTTSQRWVRGTRSWSGWLYKNAGWPTARIAPATVVWCAGECANEIAGNRSSDKSSKKQKFKRKIFVRVHPSAFLQLWEEILKVSKIQQPPVVAEDLRFQVGSIEITGPAATEVLVGVLRPSPENSEKDKTSVAGELWQSLSFLNDPASLPPNVLLSLDVSDPRLHHPPRKQRREYEPNIQQHLLHTLSAWTADVVHPVPGIFDRSVRLEASRRLPSQKAINRRKTLATPGAYPEPIPTDPKVPVLLLSASPRRRQGSWTILLPWKCVRPVWYSIMYYPLSSGGNVRFGGLNETRQIVFEAGLPWFPGDYPGTEAGWAWEASEREKRKREWEKRPKGKRVEWDSINLGGDRRGEIGYGWACHWEQLLDGQNETSAGKPVFYHLPASSALQKLSNPTTNSIESDLKGGLVMVKLTMLKRGAPTTCARIYRIPTQCAELRKSWLALATSSKRKAKRSPMFTKPPPDAPIHVHRQYLAASLLEQSPEIDLQTSDQHDPNTPGEEDLIGFVTTGNFNLGEGKGTAIGCMLLQKVLDAHQPGSQDGPTNLHMINRLCIVRDAGQSNARLARWELV